MEFRVLQYFLAVTREQSISKAVKYLHLSQPTLSRQLRDMEEELGKKLFIRSNRKITLTEEGILLRKRAEEIVELVQKTEKEISLSDEILAGDIHIGAGETEGFRNIVKVANQLRKDYPLIHFHIISGDKSAVLEDLDHGLIDFALIFGDIDDTRYDSIILPSMDYFGVMMKKNDILSEKEVITPKDLIGKPLIVSRQIIKDNDLHLLFGCNEKQLNIVGSYNLLFNSSIMVEEGIGYAICFDNIINTTGISNLCFRPLSIEIRPKTSLIWKKYQIFTKAAEKFLIEFEKTIKKLE